ncbi:MAG: polysaccharide biosynthesis protein [bacterium]|nr:polysaccharide biosynthesis protein [bacterium]
MSNKSSQILKQAGILAMAGFICRIIGFIYRIPLTNIIGDRGNGYYGVAYSVYSIILLITSYSIPGAVSKVMAERLAMKEYRNAQKVFHCSMIYVVAVGGLASLLTFFVSPFFVSHETALVLRVFCPTIFFSGVLGVYRGYFQAHRTMVQSSISQIFEQIMNAVVSLSMAAFFVNLAAGSNDEVKIAVNGAVGSAMGTGAGVLTALLFMLVVYRVNKDGIQRKIARDESGYEESYGTIFKVIMAMVTPIVLSTFIYNINTTLNVGIFTKVSSLVNLYDENTATELYGVFSGKAVVLINVPIAIASAMASSLLPNIAGTFAMHGEREASQQVNDTLKLLMIIVIPITVGMFIFSAPIMMFMYPRAGQWELAANLLRILSVDVIFISISTLSNAVLQALGQPQKTVVNALIALVIQTVILVGLLTLTNLGVYSLAIATVSYAIIMCVLNRTSVLRYLSYKQNIMTTYIYPIIASLIMGAVSCGMYLVLYKVYPSNRIVLIIAVVIAIFVYFASIIKLGGLSEKELGRFPKGTKLVSMAYKLRLLS